jgi:surface antigen
MQQPTIGRVVHFYQSATQGKPHAALVTDVHSASCVNVAGFNSGGTQVSASSVIFSEDPAAGIRWCWPPRV